MVNLDNEQEFIGYLFNLPRLHHEQVRAIARKREALPDQDTREGEERIYPHVEGFEHYKPDRIKYAGELWAGILAALQSAEQQGERFLIPLDVFQVEYLKDVAEKLRDSDLFPFLRDGDLHPAGREALRALQLVGHPGERKDDQSERNREIFEYVKRLKNEQGVSLTGENGAFERAAQKYKRKPGGVREIYYSLRPRKRR